MVSARASASSLTIALTVFHGMEMLFSYTTHASHRNSREGAPGVYLLDVTVSGFLCVYGLWVLVFGFGPGRVSRRTGRDGRVSGWPFGRGVKGRGKRD